MGHALARAASSGEADGFVLEFHGNGGVVSRALSQCWAVEFERCAPVRSFPTYRGQTSFPGWWWFAKTGEHVGYESWLERDHVMALDADPEVVGVASQPFWLHWKVRDAERRHAPDYFVRTRGGGAVVFDVRADDRIEERDAVAFAATEKACAAMGWTYRRVGAIDPVLAANLRWISGYRHPRCSRPGLVASLREVFTEPGELLAGAAAVGDPIVVLPTLFHLLWSGSLIADLAGEPLWESTRVSVR